MELKWTPHPTPTTWNLAHLVHIDYENVFEDHAHVLVLGRLPINEYKMIAYKIKLSHALLHWKPMSIDDKSHCYWGEGNKTQY